MVHALDDVLSGTPRTFRSQGSLRFTRIATKPKLILASHLDVMSSSTREFLTTDGTRIPLELGVLCSGNNLIDLTGYESLDIGKFSRATFTPIGADKLYVWGAKEQTHDFAVLNWKQREWSICEVVNLNDNRPMIVTEESIAL